MSSESQKSIIRNEKLATLGKIAAEVAHEIKNPLTLIRSLTERSLSSLLNHEEIKEERILHLQNILKATHRIERIIKHIHFFSQTEDQAAFEKTALQLILDETIALCSERLKQELIHLRLPPLTEDIEIECRSTQISQVLVNLIQNAQDAIQNHTEKWIQIEIHPDLQAKQVQILVTDSGKGIPEQTAIQLMKPFFTTKAAGKGTGLGLSICQRILAEHGGKIYLKEGNPHTQFVLELPFNQATALEG